MAIADPLAEFHERLGGIPLSRIVLNPPPGTATEEDALAAAEAPQKRLCELVDGVLVEKAMGYWESQIAFYLGSLIVNFVVERDLGAVTGSDGTFRLRPGSVRIPDIAFTSWKRLEGEEQFEHSAPPVAPELAIEILSESNTASEMARKREDYFKAGVVLVWEIDPIARTARVERINQPVRMFVESDNLDGEDILPGFSVQLADIFRAVKKRKTQH